MSVTDELYTGADKDTDRDKDDAKEMPGQEFEKGVTEFKWKLFTQCYGFGDGVSITMEINTWPELPLDFGSLDLHFVELCTDSTALYKTGTSMHIATYLRPLCYLCCLRNEITPKLFLQIHSLESIARIQLGWSMSIAVDVLSMTR